MASRNVGNEKGLTKRVAYFSAAKVNGGIHSGVLNLNERKSHTKAIKTIILRYISCKSLLMPFIELV